MNNNDNDYFDFKSDESLRRGFAADYLRQYYSPERSVTDDEAAVYRFIRKVSSTLSGVRGCLEIGCGPTLHHAIMLAPLVASIDLADYLDENLAFVDSWRKKEPDAWDWSAYTRFCLIEDGDSPTEEAVEKREELTRKRIRELLNVNLLATTPFEDNARQYDLVSAFYCTEEIAMSKQGWLSIMTAIARMIKPHGYLLISCLENTDFYQIRGVDGSTRNLPCLRLTKEDLHNALLELGFRKGEMIIESIKTAEQAMEGVPGVLLSLARKGES